MKGGDLMLDDPRVLITGADGYLGTRVARRLLAAGDRTLILTVRARDRAELREKEARLRRALGAEGDARVEVVAADLLDAAPFAQVDPRRVGAWIHAAALVRFDLEREAARAVNVEGTARALAFARRCPRLTSFGLVSSVYATGLQGGVIDEELAHPAGFANEYERSKCEAEHLLAESGLPWQAFRVATVVADDDSGRVGQRNFFHKTLQLLHDGLASTFPGEPRAHAYLATGAFVADGIATLVERGARGVFHLSPAREQSLDLARFMDVAFAAFESQPAWRRRLVPRPLFLDAQAFALLGEALSTFGGAHLRDLLRGLRPFAAQLYVEKDVRHARLAEALGSLRFPDPAELVTRVCAGLAHDWDSATHIAGRRLTAPA
jgi:nucleoside-diphosphate-sugar epimerase